MKLSEIVTISGSLTKFITLNLPAQVAWDYRKFAKIVTAELQDFNKDYNDLIVKHGEPVADNPSQFTLSGKNFTKEKMDAFQKDYDALVAVEIELPLPAKVSRSIIKGDTLSALDMANLEFLLTD